ncbi:MAG: benzoate-CoA ligase family protein [Betaproteobacteria bacterium]|nr:benzoate-CoA ligase family protein [Betaproteobacteria bacterium]
MHQSVSNNLHPIRSTAPMKMQLSQSDHQVTPPSVVIPQVYNAAADLLSRHDQRAQKAAYINGLTGESLSYGQLHDQAHRFAQGLKDLGFEQEHRVLLCMHDKLTWPVAFLGCILAGVVPIAINTLLTPNDYQYVLRDSRAQGLIVSQALWPVFETLLPQVMALRQVIVDGEDDSTPGIPFAQVITQSSPLPQAAHTLADEVCFWLYSSGSTGSPKGTLHLHSHLVQTAELYGRGVLGLKESDVGFSAAKLFFAYGLGNALSFPLLVGATTVLLSARPTTNDVFAMLKKHQPTVFYGVPTLYASLLADAHRPIRNDLNLRICTSAGEALPAEIGKKWHAEYGVDILDGIGSTEMLHIFLSNRPGRVRYGTTGEVVPGYSLRLVNDEDRECAEGELGELQISGPSSAIMYWNNREKTKHTFAGEWTRSGDKYSRDADGYYTYGGRSDDMLKVGGIYVSPFEVEASLMTHPSVLEAAVIGVSDEEGLVKPKAYVVIKPGESLDEATLKAHVKSQLAPYKYPRWVAFIDELPKTATGKIQRFKLRAEK